MFKRYTSMLIALLLAAVTLSACGQKGPLYLPSAASGQATPR